MSKREKLLSGMKLEEENKQANQGQTKPTPAAKANLLIPEQEEKKQGTE